MLAQAVEDCAMSVYTAARIEIVLFAGIAFWSGYYWPSWIGIAGVVFLAWAGATMLKDEWDEQKLAKEHRMLSQRLFGKAKD
jgi:threonine/homoserine/homoserine lactone efflux protein